MSLLLHQTEGTSLSRPAELRVVTPPNILLLGIIDTAADCTQAALAFHAVIPALLAKECNMLHRAFYVCEPMEKRDHDYTMFETNN